MRALSRTRQDPAAAVADADLDLWPAIGAGHGEALPDEGLVEGVRRVPPGFAGLAHEGRDTAPGGIGQEIGVLLVEPADCLDHVLARDGAASTRRTASARAAYRDRDEALGWLELLERCFPAPRRGVERVAGPSAEVVRAAAR